MVKIRHLKDWLREILLSDFSKRMRKQLRKQGVPLLPCEVGVKSILTGHRIGNNFIDLLIE